VKPLHLLWALFFFFLKTTPSSLDVTGSHLRCDPRTLVAHLEPTLEALDKYLPPVRFAFVLILRVSVH
jgi:hypothetical protein